MVGFAYLLSLAELRLLLGVSSHSYNKPVADYLVTMKPTTARTLN